MKVKLRIEPSNQIIFDIANEYNCIMKIVNANCSLESIEKIAAESAEHFENIKSIVINQKTDYDNKIECLRNELRYLRNAKKSNLETIKNISKTEKAMYEKGNKLHSLVCDYVL